LNWRIIACSRKHNIVGMMQENRCLALFALVAKWKNAGVRLEALGRFATAKTRTPDGGQAFC
jgi:hypothetical protein